MYSLFRSFILYFVCYIHLFLMDQQVVSYRIVGPLLKVHVFSGLFGLAVDDKGANKLTRLVDD